MKKLLCLLVGFIVLFSSCKGKDASVKNANKSELTKEERIEQRTKELEKKISESLEKPGGKGGSWGDAPDFTLETVSGGKLTLSEYAGKVIILDFWATWCGPCRMGIPEFVKMYSEYRDKGFVMIGVNLDKGGEDKVRSFAKKMGINYPMVFGGQQTVSSYGGIRGIPTAFIIDRKGNIVKKVVGYRPRSFFEDEIKKLL